MGSWIRSVWERKGILGKLGWALTLPFSWVYRCGVQARNLSYGRQWLKARALDQPVISIGNLTVGGTGKTPTCVWLAQALARRGFRVAILTRGYRRKETRPVILTPKPRALTGDNLTADLSAAGDEPLMMARLYDQTIAVGKDRYAAAKELLGSQAVDVFILDDGFQHRRLKRDIDLLLLGNDAAGGMLPCGPFREPKSAGRRADFFLVTGAHEKWRSFVDGRPAGSCYKGSLHAAALVSFERERWKEHPLNLLYRSRILAVSGVADASGFYAMIRAWEGNIVDTLAFPDHHDYTSQDWQQINRQGHHADLILTTEKDLVKLIRFPFAKNKLMALRVAMEIENAGELLDAIARRIEAR